MLPTAPSDLAAFPFPFPFASRFRPARGTEGALATPRGVPRARRANGTACSPDSREARSAGRLVRHDIHPRGHRPPPCPPPAGTGTPGGLSPRPLLPPALLDPGRRGGPHAPAPG